ncbi:hypothetical protein AGMMS50293_12960 [Spirochaetia bacterium]|nr:hypothetical protein AGMMS50293_12960 [Spirochaetia bacterium]
MEELQSTEILDREILEDARKKAYRILKTADETVKAKAAEREAKARAALDELNKKYAEQRKLAAQEIMARLPMDKRRARAEKIESLILSATEAWYAGLDRRQVLSLLENGLRRRLTEYGSFSKGSFAEGKKPRAFICKLERAEAEAVLQAVYPGQGCEIVETPAADPYPVIILEDDFVRITASIHEAADFFLQEKRAELIASLLGTQDLPGESLC